MKKHKKIIVIGLGRFGVSMVETLVELGFDVLAVDRDEELVQKRSGICDYVVQADCTDEETLNKLGIEQFDVAVVAIGRDTHANLMVSLLLIEMKIPYVIAKCESTIQGKMLAKIGVNRVIYPEKDMAIRVAHNISTKVLEFVEFSSQFSMVEALIPPSLLGKKMNELNEKLHHNVIIVGVKRHEQVMVSPFPNTKLYPDDILIAFGPISELEKMGLLG